MSGAPPGNGATLSSLLGGGIGDSSEEEGASEQGDPSPDESSLREGAQNGAQEGAGNEEGGSPSGPKRARIDGGGVASGGACHVGGCGVESQKSAVPSEVRVASTAPEAKREKEEEGGEVAVQA